MGSSRAMSMLWPASSWSGQRSAGLPRSSSYNHGAALWIACASRGRTIIFSGGDNALLLHLWSLGLPATWELADAATCKRSGLRRIRLEHRCAPVRSRISLAVKASVRPPLWGAHLPLCHWRANQLKQFWGRRGEESSSGSLPGEAAAFPMVASASRSSSTLCVEREMWTTGSVDRSFPAALAVA